MASTSLTSTMATTPSMFNTDFICLLHVVTNCQIGFLTVLCSGIVIPNRFALHSHLDKVIGRAETCLQTHVELI